MKIKKILIMAGGTGGHIFPALTIAEAMRHLGIEVHWIGSVVGLEKQIVALHYPIYYVSIDRIRGKSIGKKILAPFRILRAIKQAQRILRSVKPQLVLGMGGFVSGPGGIAAWLLRIPLIIHEQNAVAGYTNRILARVAKKILCGFPNTFAKNSGALVVGNPVRPAISALPPYSFRKRNPSGPLRVLVLGGSQGARPINQVMLKVLRELSADNHNFDIWHQTGELDYQSMMAEVQQLSIKIKMDAFIIDMVSAYAWADIIVCRAGAMTVAEITAAGIASIFIPLPSAADNHQLYNCRYLAEKDAAIIIEQINLSAERLIELFNLFFNDRDMLQIMGEKARQLGFPNAISHIVEACIDIDNRG